MDQSDRACAAWSVLMHDFVVRAQPEAVAYPGGVLRVLKHPPKAEECNNAND